MSLAPPPPAKQPGFQIAGTGNAAPRRTSPRSPRRRNCKIFAGTPDKDGYICIKIDQKVYKAHRLAWLWMTGAWPIDEVDHKDLDKSNNRFDNLREATHSENNRNRRKRGYVLDKRRGTFSARINIAGKNVHLGQFKTSAEATAAFNAVAIPLHGEFAREAQ
jgi:hypothetical protein